MWIDDKGNLFQISDSIYRINDSTTLSSLCNDDECVYVGYIHECVLVCTVACTVACTVRICSSNNICDE